jgi:hypothetical protein
MVGLALAADSFHDQIFILTEQDAAEFTGATEQFGIGESCGLIFLCRENIHSTPSQTSCDE